MRLAEHNLYTFEWDAEAAILAFLWTEATANMTDEDFKEALSRYAERAKACGAKCLLVDVSRFQHALSPELGSWRDKTISPRYNEAGVRRFAYVIGEGRPLPPASDKARQESRTNRCRNA